MRTDSPIATVESLGFLLAKASQRFNQRLVAHFADGGFPEVRASFGSVLMPLFGEDDLRIGELAARAALSKQSMTTLVRACEEAGLVQRRRDPDDARAFRVRLTRRGMRFQRVAEGILAELDAEVLARLGRQRRDALVEALKGVMEL
jgi:DNA-binding MarR family transcriptional regulator